MLWSEVESVSRVENAVSSRAGRHGKARLENGILRCSKRVCQAEGDSRRQTGNSQSIETNGRTDNTA